MAGRGAEFARLIIHDRRRSGASTRNVSPPNLESRAADLFAVLDAVESEAPVLGAGASTGAMHALFAATYPDRASGLVWNYPRAHDFPGLRIIRGGRGLTVFDADLAEAGTGGRASTPVNRRRTAPLNGRAFRMISETR